MKKTLLVLFWLPLYSFSQNSAPDSIEIDKIGVFHPRDYPNSGVHSFWIDCENPLLFINENVDFNLVKYQVQGGTFVQGKEKNHISIIPFNPDIKIALVYKDKYLKEFLFKAVKLPRPEFELVNSKQDTMTDKIRISYLDKIKAIPSIHPGLKNDLEHVPVNKIVNCNYILTRQDGLDSTIIIYKADHLKDLVELKKKAKKNDTLRVEANFISDRYSFIKSKHIHERNSFLKTFIVE